MLIFTNIHFLLCKNFKGEILNIPIFKGNVLRFVRLSVICKLSQNQDSLSSIVYS